MIEESEKIHIAMAAFYEIALLLKVLEDIHSAGLDKDNLWLAGKAHLFAAHSDLHRALASHLPALETFMTQTDHFGRLPGGAALHGTIGRSSQFIRLSVGPNGKSCLQCLLDGQIGTMMTDAENGALIVTTRTRWPEIQDQCMRVLLKHTRNTVFSREFRHRKSQDPKYE